jgi:hypothetical protein
VLDYLARAISAFSPNQLQDAALLYLRLRGFQNPELCDGWNDGGTDLRVWQPAGFPGRFIIQASVEKKWHKKLESDLRKSLGNYDVRAFLFITTRYIPELDFQRLRDRLFAETGVAVDKADAQTLASVFYEEGRVNELLAVAGITADGSANQVPQETTFLGEACFGFLFFSPAVQEFRHDFVDQAVSVYLSHRGATERQALAAELRMELGLPKAQEAQIRTAIDRMLQAGRLIVDPDGRLYLSPIEQDHRIASQALASAAWSELRHDVIGKLRPLLSADAAAAADSILPYLGAAASASGKVIAGAFGRLDTQEFSGYIRKRLVEANARMEALGLTEPAVRDNLLKELAKLITSSAIGRSLEAAELFVYLSGLSPTGLSQALGAAAHAPTLVLDSNVIMPLLGNSYFATVPGRFSAAASQLYRVSRALGLRLEVPLVYLEEAAAHLIDARKYSDLVDSDDDFRLSTNAWVAHYSALRKIGRSSTFGNYLAGLGGTPAILARPFTIARRSIMHTLRQLLERYGIAVSADVGYDKADAEAAERDLAWASQRFNRPRLKITERHDAVVLASMRKLGGRGEAFAILCTWDRLLLATAAEVDSAWTAIDPPAAVDLLSLTSPHASSLSAINVLSIVAELSEETSAKGAAILDWLAKTQAEKLQDAELRRLALGFKSQYLKTSEDVRESILAEAWTKWTKPAPPVPQRQTSELHVPRR